MSHGVKLFTAFNNLLFARISATGFGLMRIAWGFTIFIWMLSMWQDVTFYYSNSGIITPEFYSLVFRSEYRLTILDTVTSPSGVWMLYSTLLFSALMTCIGFVPRFFTITTLLLFFSFQERNLLYLGGGDTLLRNIGYILAISPELKACSLVRLRAQWKSWKKDRVLLPGLTMSIWPYRLLLWQAIILYVYTGIEKSSGTMWLDGTAIEVFFHHPNFFRWSKVIGDALTPLSTFASYFTLLFEYAWLILFVPARYLEQISCFSYGSIKRGLICCGILFHLSLFVLADVGIFPLALLTMYCGLLLQEDFTAMRQKFTRKQQEKITLLYDGKCGLCIRSVFALTLFDFLKRIHPLNFHTAAERKRVAPTLKFADLDKAMHIVTSSGRTEKGFDAFRLLSWHIPLLWVIAPLFYIPGVPPIGRRIYSWIANKRKKCSHERCGIRLKK